MANISGLEAHKVILAELKKNNDAYREADEAHIKALLHVIKIEESIKQGEAEYLNEDLENARGLFNGRCKTLNEALAQMSAINQNIGEDSPAWQCETPDEFRTKLLAKPENP